MSSFLFAFAVVAIASLGGRDLLLIARLSAALGAGGRPARGGLGGALTATLGWAAGAELEDRVPLRAIRVAMASALALSAGVAGLPALIGRPGPLPPPGLW